MTLWLPLLLGGLLAGPPLTDRPARTDVPDPLSVEVTPRVRAADAVLRRLIADGQRRSTTFADLVAAVNATDVIVYVQRVERLPPAVDGHLMLVPMANAQRYLRIQVRASLTPNELIALIGHELRHALEVAAAPAVRTQAQMVALYASIGHSSSGAHAYDTTAAQHAGLRVRRELAS